MHADRACARCDSFTARTQVNILCQAAGLLVTVKTQQFKREIAAKKDGGKSKLKRGTKDKKASKQE